MDSNASAEGRRLARAAVKGVILICGDRTDGLRPAREKFRIYFNCLKA